MARANENEVTPQPAPLRISRTFKAPRELVFQAWVFPDHVKRWFCPTSYTIPQANVQMRVGGPFEVCMRSPEGVDHWTRGTFAEISKPARLVLDLHAVDAQERPLFRAYTEVSFTEVAGGTRVDVVQTYTFVRPEEAAAMVKGAPMGWSQTLDKLDAEIERMQGGAAITRSVAHGSFTLKRTYEAPVALVFKALSNEAAKSKWFVGPEGQWRLIERRMDFRVGGRERVQGRFEGGVVTTFDALYQDIIPNERIIYTYEMHLDDKKISVSLATLQLKQIAEDQTTLTVTEQGAFLDGYDDAGSREAGTEGLLDRLGESLKS